MGCKLSRRIEDKECVKTPSVVIGTAVDASATHDREELFRSKDIVVARVPPQGKESRVCYHLTHGKAHATFYAHAALIEAFLSEVRAHIVGDSCSATVAVTNASGVHLTHLYVWKEPTPHHDEAATNKLMNVLHSFCTPETK